MVSTVQPKIPQPDTSEPAWDIARLFPAQGHWNDADYLALDTNHLVEFEHGTIEVLSIPTPGHQGIVLYLYDEVRQFIRPAKLGEVLVAPMRIRLAAGRYREPDLMFMLSQHSSRKGTEYWDGADLVIEVVSEDAKSRDCDILRKKIGYAEAGIPEYWIVDPRDNRITVWSLRRDEYVLHGDFKTGQHASSVILPGLSIGVDHVLAAGIRG